MTNLKAYFPQFISDSMLVGSKHHLAIFIILFSILPCISSFAQINPEYEELSIFLDIPEVGGGETDVLINGTEVFLPITVLFDYLRIRNVASANLDTITGFVINPESSFIVDRPNNLIVYNKTIYELQPGDLIRTDLNLYLKSSYFGKIFGIECLFSFRSLSVTVNTRFELPVIREMRQQEIRQNLNRVIDKVEADTTIGRRYPMFHFGTADWSVVATEQVNGPSEVRLRLGMGAMLFGGEATVALNYNSHFQITEREQFYLWRYVNNKNKALRQILAGKIATNATASIYDPIIGIQLTNQPSAFRRSFGTYTLTDKTEPGWIVELYVNNVLVDYVKADASGFFKFEVPMVYGNMLVRLKFFGPWGEERVRDRFITTPFNFIPKNKLEYAVSAGVVEDSVWSRFSRARVNYGLTRGITIGAGYEYLSSVSSGPFMPFIEGSFRLAPNLLLSGEYTHTVRARGTLTYRMSSNLQFDLDFIRYAQGQKAINNNYQEERKASITLPFRVRKFSAFTRLSATQLILPSYRYSTGEWLLSASLSRVSANLTSYVILVDEQDPNIYSNLSVAVRLPYALTVIPQTQYSYTEEKFISAKFSIEKRVLEFGYLTASYEQNFRSNQQLAEIGFRYDFKFAQTGMSAIRTNNNSLFVQYARGSLINDSKTKYFRADRISNVGKGGITIIPFLDKNANGKMDKGEPKAYGLNLRSSGGRIERSEKDTLIRITNLEPYSDCFIQFDQGGFNNVAWQLEYETMNVEVDPNLLKVIEVPIKIAGEASGMVLIDRKGQEVGLGRIIINFYSNNKKVGQTLSEQDGYFSFFGLNPGDFYARIDTVQLGKLGMTCSPDTMQFKITENLEGDYIDGLEFKLKRIPKLQDAQDDEIPVKKDTIHLISQETSEEVKKISPTNYAIQLGAYQDMAEAEALKKKIVTHLDKEVTILEENGVSKMQINGFNTLNAVENSLPLLESIGINEVWIISPKGTQQVELLSTKSDTIPDLVDKSADFDSTYPVVHRSIENDNTSTVDTYAIQLGVFSQKQNAESLKKRLSIQLSSEIEIRYQKGFYKLLVVGLQSDDEVDQELTKLKSNGVNEVVLITQKGTFQTENISSSPDTITDIIESISGKDTAYLIVHEVIKEVTTSYSDSYAIQLGAFRSKANAYNYREKLNGLLNEIVKVIIEDGYYKVRIMNLESRQDLDNYLPTLINNKIYEIWIVHLKGVHNHLMVSTRMDTIVDGSEDIIATDKNKFILQLGAFKIRSNAYAYRKKLVSLFGTEFKILRADDFYKIRIGFSAKNEITGFIPVLKKKDVKEVWVVPQLNELR